MIFKYSPHGHMNPAFLFINFRFNGSCILERNPQIKPAGGFERIDADWLGSKLA